MKFWSNADTPGDNNQVPERRLLAAVLQRAITDYLTGDGDLKESARSWLMDDEPTDAPLTFEFICEALDLDYRGLKEAIREQGEGSEKMADSVVLATSASAITSNNVQLAV
jgi:hypothetical protein